MVQLSKYVMATAQGNITKQVSSGFEMRRPPERITMLSGRFGVTNARMLTVSNMWGQFTDDDAAHVSQMFSGRATLLGSIDRDESFADRMTAGFIPTDATGVTPVIRQLLHTITGNPDFQLIQPAAESKVRRLFRRRK